MQPQGTAILGPSAQMTKKSELLDTPGKSPSRINFKVHAVAYFSEIPDNPSIISTIAWISRSDR